LVVDISWSHVIGTNAVIAMKRHTIRGLAKQTKLQKVTMLLLVMPVAEEVQVLVLEVPVVVDVVVALVWAEDPVVALVWAEDPVVALVWAEDPAVALVWAEDPAVALVWAEDPAVVDVVVQVLVVGVEEVLWVEVRVVEECLDTFKDHFRTLLHFNIIFMLYIFFSCFSPY
jgi:hypothetical protein